MRTSRISRETAKLAAAAVDDNGPPRRQTRSIAASVRSFRAKELFTDSLELSDAANVAETDIEDAPFPELSARKRKRGTTAIEEVTISTVPLPGNKITSSEVATGARTSAKNKPQKAKRLPAKRVVGHDGDIDVKPPHGWEDVYNTMKEMRKDRLAPVDTMGCETLAEAHLSPVDRRFQTLIALMLSSQTKDTTNAIAMRRLQTELPSPGLTLQNILAVQHAKLNDMIYVVGFHNTKTKHIKATAGILRDQFNGDIPNTVEGLMSLPGVGPKMAYLCLSAAWGRTEGIGVDVHVHRITNLWAWHKTRTPEETRIMLQSWLPREKWHEINHLLVGFGQTICTPVGRKCSTCKLGQRSICPSAIIERKTIKKSSKQVKQEIMMEDADFKVESV